MKAFVGLRGYCIPFRQVALADGAYEFVEPGAFDRQVAGHHRAFINYRDHEAPPLARPLTLFADAYGLGFSVSVSADDWSRMRWGVTKSGETNFCSVGFADWQVENLIHDGQPYRRVTAATIEHVTITGPSAVYAGTGVWPAEVNGDMPPRLAALAARWEIGWQAHRARRERERVAWRAARSKAQSAVTDLSAFRRRLVAHGRDLRDRIMDRVATNPNVQVAIGLPDYAKTPDRVLALLMKSAAPTAPAWGARSSSVERRGENGRC